MKQISTILFFLLLCFFSTSAQGIPTKSKKKSLYFYEKFNLKQTVSEIAEYAIVESAFVGYGGRKSEQYQRFIKLKINASNSELVLLTKHYSAAVKAYAFWALTDRDFPTWQIIQDHKNDKQTFKYESGCIVENMSIDIFFMRLTFPSYNILDTNIL
jgi:hypothetical protein